MKISLGGYGQPYTEPIAEMKQKQNGSFTQVNYASPNSKNLDNFIRLELPSVIISILVLQLKLL
jgi:hypothetical protein